MKHNNLDTTCLICGMRRSDPKHRARAAKCSRKLQVQRGHKPTIAREAK